MHACILTCVPLFAALWTVAHEASLSKGFLRQEYWSVLPFPSPGDLSDPRDQAHISCGCGRYRFFNLSYLGSLLRKCNITYGFPGGSAGKESAWNAGDLGSIPGLGRFPWRREMLPTPVFWSGEFHGLNSPWGRRESDMTERLSLHLTSVPW